MDKLTVWCVCVGDKYNTKYIYALKQMVEENLTVDHSFKCITTHKLPGINTVKPFVPYQSWWSKFSLWELAKGPSIYLDLDVVITGNIDYLVDYTNTFSAPSNWAKSGHGGIQSSVMCWAGNWRFPLDEIQKVWPGTQDNDGYRLLNGKRFWGDQEFLTEILDDWQEIPGVGSYKYHVMPLNDIPEWMTICVFHGKPDPHEVNDKCILQYTQILRSLINEPTLNTSNRGLSGTG